MATMLYVLSYYFTFKLNTEKFIKKNHFFKQKTQKANTHHKCIQSVYESKREPGT